MKGGKVQFKAAWQSDGRILTYLLNDPEGFFNQLSGEITKEEAAGKKGGYAVTVRWHDAGDFFSPEYLNLAFDIASAQTGGRGQLSDTKVKAVVSQMPLESQPESTKKARWRAVVTRVDEANKTLPENKKIEIPSEVKKYFGVGDEQSSAPSGPKEGDKTVSKSGKPIIFTNGKWEYQ